MKNEFPLYPELTESGKAEAQQLMTRFEKDLNTFICDKVNEIKSEFYCKILPHIESDSWQNFRNYLINGICNYDNKQHSKSDFDRIRRSILVNHREDLVKDLNQDLIKEIERLKKEIITLHQGMRF